MDTPDASDASERASERADVRTRWSYGEDFLSWKAYDQSKGLRYTRETLDAMMNAHESFREQMRDLDADIDDPEERALNLLRRTRANPTRAPDEPSILLLRPFNAEPGHDKQDIKYAYMHELTTVGEVMAELAKMEDTAPCTVSLVHAGRRLQPEAWTLSDCGVHPGYVVYWRVDKHLVELPS